MFCLFYELHLLKGEKFAEESQKKVDKIHKDEEKCTEITNPFLFTFDTKGKILDISVQKN